jgi:hypothetical protein
MENGGQGLPAMRQQDATDLEEVQRALLGLYDELTETFSWTALLCDGLCGLMADQAPDIDLTTHTGMRFAAIWLKGRNQRHATELQTACRRLWEIRERQNQLQSRRVQSTARGK